MKAPRWHGAGDVRLDDVEPPGPPGPGQLTLEVLACGICGTDVEEWREGPMLIPVGTPHPLTGARAPLPSATNSRAGWSRLARGRLCRSAPRWLSTGWSPAACAESAGADGPTSVRSRAKLG